LNCNSKFQVQQEAQLPLREQGVSFVHSSYHTGTLGHLGSFEFSYMLHVEFCVKLWRPEILTFFTAKANWNKEKEMTSKERKHNEQSRITSEWTDWKRSVTLYRCRAALLLLRTCSDTYLAPKFSTIAREAWSISFCAKPSRRYDLFTAYMTAKRHLSVTNYLQHAHLYEMPKTW